MATKKDSMIKKRSKENKIRVKTAASSNISIVEDAARYYELPSENLTSGIVLHKMSELMELYLKIVQQILQPEEFHSLHECAVFDDAEKSKMFELYSRIIIGHREILRAIVLNDEKDKLSTLKYMHSEILAVKPMMLDIIKKMQHSWKIDFSKELKSRKMQYFG